MEQHAAPCPKALGDQQGLILRHDHARLTSAVRFLNVKQTAGFLVQKNSGSVQCTPLLRNKYASLAVTSGVWFNILKLLLNSLITSPAYDNQPTQIGNKLHLKLLIEGTN